jgi:hypothetical protein
MQSGQGFWYAPIMLWALCKVDIADQHCSIFSGDFQVTTQVISLPSKSFNVFPCSSNSGVPSIPVFHL